MSKYLSDVLLLAGLVLVIMATYQLSAVAAMYVADRKGPL
jgi:hypothetical protein